MSENLEKIKTATEILIKHRVAEIVSFIFENSYCCKSISDNIVRFNKNATRDFIGENGCLLVYQNNEIKISTTEFKEYNMFGDVDYLADGLIHFDGTEVLRVQSSMIYNNYGGRTTKFDTHFIKNMKAGPWLKMLETCYELLQENQRKMIENDSAERIRKQAGEIDLGSY